MLTFLFVCTGNICRSPLAHALMADRSQRLLDGAVRVRSAGTWAGRDNPAMPEAVAVGREHGVDASPHRSRPLTRELIEEADLVLGMTGEHVEEILELVPEAAPKTFSLKQLAVLLSRQAPAGGGASVRARIAAAQARRVTEPGGSGDLDVGDPIGLGLEAYREAGRDIAAGIDALVEGLFGVREPAGSGGR